MAWSARAVYERLKQYEAERVEREQRHSETSKQWEVNRLKDARRFRAEQGVPWEGDPEEVPDAEYDAWIKRRKQALQKRSNV